MTRHTVMVSLWQRAELLAEDDGWSMVVDDRWFERIDEAEVLARFGRGALDRRAARGSDRESGYDRRAPLIAESVSEAIERRGWMVEASDRLSFRATAAGARIDVEAQPGRDIRVRAQVGELTVDERTEDVSAVEQRLLDLTAGDR
ncbi:hypothetical protein [Microbacterium sp. EF45047]|uniref:hypothetical protein n=1 Tax=Microbacterium sp. EF45047 TaxID=2809708 RepID=UPI0023498ABF|nr:hypothetical protein [Microbacterium sp. EF45047]WCM55757.1 hypothetical protein JRG78_00380 [Microbacterium sp. EF45047]